MRSSAPDWPAASLLGRRSVVRSKYRLPARQVPDAQTIRSQPGLGTILGARVLAEFGDGPHRHTDARARKNYSGMSPVTSASGTRRAVLARAGQPRSRKSYRPCSSSMLWTAAPKSREFAVTLR